MTCRAGWHVVSRCPRTGGSHVSHLEDHDTERHDRGEEAPALCGRALEAKELVAFAKEQGLSGRGGARSAMRWKPLRQPPETRLLNTPPSIRCEARRGARNDPESPGYTLHESARLGQSPRRYGRKPPWRHVIEIDPPSRVHAAAAVDRDGRCVAEHGVGAAPRSTRRLDRAELVHGESRTRAEDARHAPLDMMPFRCRRGPRSAPLEQHGQLSSAQREFSGLQGAGQLLQSERTDQRKRRERLGQHERHRDRCRSRAPTSR